jgi:hypothetical protein
VKEAIQRLKRGKAKGNDGIPNEFLKELKGIKSLEMLRVLFDKGRKLQYIPEQWKESRMVLLH